MLSSLSLSLTHTHTHTHLQNWDECSETEGCDCLKFDALTYLLDENIDHFCLLVFFWNVCLFMFCYSVCLSVCLSVCWHVAKLIRKSGNTNFLRRVCVSMNEWMNEMCILLSRSTIINENILLNCSLSMCDFNVYDNLYGCEDAY